MKKRKAPWARIKRNQENEVTTLPSERRKSHGGIIIAVVFILLIAFLTFLRIPERIGMIATHDIQEAVPSMSLTGIYKPLLSEIMESRQDEDWDEDGLKNGADPYPRDVDADRNGISDGFEGKEIISRELPVHYENARMIVSNSKSGITKFRGEYIITSFAGWISFENENGIPYIYSNNRWIKAEFERIDEFCYVNIPGSCRLKFTDGGKPDDRDVLIEAVAAEFKNRPDERYSIANAPLFQLTGIYSAVDNGRTVQISIVTDIGEQLLIVHGYDKLGNLIVAKCDTFEDEGKVKIEIRSQLFWDGKQITMRSWFEFNWAELSSENGDVLTVF